MGWSFKDGALAFLLLHIIFLYPLLHVKIDKPVHSVPLIHCIPKPLTFKIPQPVFFYKNIAEDDPAHVSLFCFLSPDPQNPTSNSSNRPNPNFFNDQRPKAPLLESRPLQIPRHQLHHPKAELPKPKLDLLPRRSLVGCIHIRAQSTPLESHICLASIAQL